MVAGRRNPRLGATQFPTRNGQLFLIIRKTVLLKLEILFLPLAAVDFLVQAK
jgi:hypothetical protein